MSLWQRFKNVRGWIHVLEILVIAGIAAVGYALLFSPPGTSERRRVTLPVRVFVFDAESGRPIPGARVAVFLGNATDSSEFSAKSVARIEHRQTQYPCKGTTSDDGTLRYGCEFARFAPLRAYWVEVESNDGTRVAVPLGREKMLMKAWPETEEISVVVGLHSGSH